MIQSIEEADHVGRYGKLRMGSFRIILERKTRAMIHAGMVRLMSGMLPLYVVNEYPKSGGTWVGQMISAALDLPMPTHRIPNIRPSVMHGHYLNPWGIKNVIVIWRDGRDVMVSLYHHCLFKNERENARLVELTRRDLSFRDYEDVRGNLPAFIEYAFTRIVSPRFTWSDFVRIWHSRAGVVHVRYEDMRRNTVNELRRAVLDITGRDLDREKAFQIADRFSFARQSGRQIGHENKASFMRKGVIGDWRNYFSITAREVFDRYAGSELIKIGYESDRSWVYEAQE